MTPEITAELLEGIRERGNKFARIVLKLVSIQKNIMFPSQSSTLKVLDKVLNIFNLYASK